MKPIGRLHRAGILALALSLAWPALGLLGIRILLPKALQKITRPNLSMMIGANRDASQEKTYLSLEKLLKFDWQIALGDQLMDAVVQEGPPRTHRVDGLPDTVVAPPRVTRLRVRPTSRPRALHPSLSSTPRRRLQLA